jgi:hypothetical protein
VLGQGGLQLAGQAIEARHQNHWNSGVILPRKAWRPNSGQLIHSLSTTVQ